MEAKLLVYFKIIALICVLGIKSQETCDSFNTEIINIDGVFPRFLGEIGNLSINDADSLTTSGNFLAYFSAELDKDQNKIQIFTTENFINYEKQNSITRPTLILNIKCKSSITSVAIIRITIAAVNNYAPEFSKSSHEIKIPTPIAKGFDITFLLPSDDLITAIDYDLYFNAIRFAINGTELFDVNAVLIDDVKPSYKARIFAKQQIVKLENDEVVFELTATDSYDEPKSTTVKIKVFSDPEISFIESPKFQQPIYRGELQFDGTLHIEDVYLDDSTFNENVKFEILDDDFGIIKISNDGPKVGISISKENLSEEIFELSFVNFVIEAKREGDRSGFTAVILEISTSSLSYSFTKTLYEGKLTEKGKTLEIEDIKLTTNGLLEGITIRTSQADAEYFIVNILEDKVTIVLKEAAAIDEIMSKNFLFVQIDAYKDEVSVAATSVTIQTIPILIPRFDKNFYSATVNDGQVNHEDIEIIENSFDSNEELVILFKDEGSRYFDAEIIERKVNLKLKSDIEFPANKSFINFQISAGVKSSNRSNSAFIFVEQKVIENPQESLKFSSSLYEGSVSQDLTLKLPDITLNNVENVDIQLLGKHGQFFEHYFDGNKLFLKLKSGIDFDQFLDDLYLHIAITASHESFNSATSNVIIAIERQSEVNSAFEKTLYVGSISDQKELKLEKISIKSDDRFDKVHMTGDDTEYFNANINENVVTVLLTKEVSEDVLMQKTILSVKIIAENDKFSISTELIVTLPKVNGDMILRFENFYYVGYINGLQLEMENVVLLLNNYDETVEFSLDGSDKSLFKFERNQNSLKIRLSDEITEEDLKNRVFLTFTVSAMKNGFVSAETVVLVHLNAIAADISPIEFEKPVYRGSLTHENNLNLEKMSIISSEKELQVSLKGENSNKFQIDYQDIKDIKILFNQPSIDLKQSFYYFYIEAVKFGAPKAYATIIIDIVDKTQLSFDKINYFGSLDSQENLIIDKIPLISSLTNSDVSFRLTEGQSEFFNFTTDLLSLQIIKKTSISIKNLNFLWFYVEAFGAGYYSDRTVIIIDYPKELDIPIDECRDKLDPSQPYFETGTYSLTFMSDETGSIGRIRALITDPDDSIATYGLLFDQNYLSDKISISGGDLRVINPIAAGFYRMIGTAVSLNSGKSAQTNILLRVLEANVCENGKPLTTVQKVLAIEKIEENEIYNEIFYAKIGDCQYEIIDIIPNVLEDYVEIDATTGYLKNVKPFDRESQYFADYSIPQVQLRMKLNCPSNDAKSTNNSTNFISNNVFTDEILYSPTVTYLNLKILDQNDNRPIFTNPPNDSYQIGFPDEELIELIMPKILYKVEAYDLDEEINAVIHYSTSMPGTFEIDPLTGEIYPLGTLPDVQSTLLITAIDRDGAGLRTTTSMGFVKLTLGDIVEMTVERFSYHDVEELVSDISEELKVDFRVLTSAQLPFEVSAQAKQYTDTLAKTKIYAYAFVLNSLDLVDPENLISLLDALELNLSIRYSTIDGCTEKKDVDNDDECDITKWIVIVSILGSIMFLMLFAIPLLWFRLRKNPQDTDTNSESSKEEIAEHFYETEIETSRRSSHIPADIVQLSREVRPTDVEITQVSVNGVTSDESTSDAARLNSKLMTYLDKHSSNPSRKVSFKELVERIEVIDESYTEEATDIKD